MVGIKLKDFQYDCVDEIMHNVVLGDKNQIIIDSPTGSGKTIILLEFIDEYIKEYQNTVFIWLTPGQGELEEQSQDKMNKYLPHRTTKTITDVLISGFNAGDTAFINWEKITRSGAIALKEAEKKNLLERISEAKSSGLSFVAIIDEEHRNNTDRANAVLSEFGATKTIRVSATPRSEDFANTIKIDEMDVINSGLITRAIYINENVEDNIKVNDEIEFLLDLAIKKRNEIKEKCIEKGILYNPLVIIQFPSMSDRLIQRVEKHLSENDYTYENGSVAKWMSNEKENIEDVKDKMSPVNFLLFKQAINTGWDCPRAKILVKLRERMSDDFEIQTIGRIRRMPEAHHYNDICLDNCYLYTFDEEYKTAVKTAYSESSEVKMAILKKEYYDFKLTKEFKDNEANIFDDRESAKTVYDFLCSKYKLKSKKNENKIILENNGFNFSSEIISNVATGKQTEISNMELDYIRVRSNVNTHINGLDLKHAIGVISSKSGMRYETGRQILERLFMFNLRSLSQKILSLGKKDFYAFIINNEEKLKDDMKEAVSQNNEQLNFQIDAIKESDFKFPIMDVVKYNPKAKTKKVFDKNVYSEYPNRLGRSNCEKLFENYCESSENIKWWYKNGESAQQYFSIIYADNLNKKWSFYPDYILQDKKGNTWIIETKGGETEDGQSKNIDKNISNKYNALQRYLKSHNLHGGFVREIDEDLFILQNEEYIEDMQKDEWESIEKYI